LAEAYRSLAWNARGGGFADPVSDANRRQFEGQDIKAFQILAEAEQLPEKCPHLYFVMLEIVRDQGASKEQTRALFERAIAFEPAYYPWFAKTFRVSTP
jgi:hypothetical protein